MKSNDLHTDEIIKCFHCGNETPMKKVGEYTFSVVAYNADGIASRTYELPVSVTDGK